MGARIDDDVRRRLASAAGDAGSVTASGAVAPGTMDQLVAVVAVCSESSTPIRVTSAVPGDTDGAGVALSLTRLQRIAVDAGSMTVRAEAGSDVAALRAAAESAGKVVVGLPGSTGAQHVGSLVARGEVPRRAITGVELLLSTGDLVVSGGRVLKDVAGYDVAGVALGSMGRAAIIVAVTFRLQPARSVSVVATAPQSTAGWSRALPAMDPGGLLRPPR